MNRRGFLSSILKAGIGAMILPAAVTYRREWRISKSGVVIPNCMTYSRMLLMQSCLDVEQFIADDAMLQTAIKINEGIINGIEWEWGE